MDDVSASEYKLPYIVRAFSPLQHIKENLSIAVWSILPSISLVLIKSSKCWGRNTSGDPGCGVHRKRPESKLSSSDLAFTASRNSSLASAPFQAPDRNSCFSGVIFFIADTFLNHTGDVASAVCPL